MTRNTDLERVAAIFVGNWTRLLGRVEANRMVGHADASEDQGATWRKNLDLVFERVR
jgi:hypothetical protein